MSFNDYENGAPDHQVPASAEKRPDDKPVKESKFRKTSASFYDWFRELSKNARTLVIAAVILVVAFSGFGIWKGTMAVFTNREGEVVTSLKSALKRVEECSSLSTLEYTYNSVVPVYADEK